jgi:UPF0755 protein
LSPLFRREICSRRRARRIIEAALSQRTRSLDKGESVASACIYDSVPLDDAARARRWAYELARSFKRVAVFALRATEAEVVALEGMGPQALGLTLSLVDRTPLRWSLEAASPIVGAGRGPGGELIANALGLRTPRAYAVIPIVAEGRIAALAYADTDAEAIDLGQATAAFALCHESLRAKAERVAPGRVRGAHASPHRQRTPRRATASIERRCAPAPEPVLGDLDLEECTPPTSFAPPPPVPRAAAMAAAAEPAPADEARREGGPAGLTDSEPLDPVDSGPSELALVTPDGVVPLCALRVSPLRLLARAAVAAAALLLLVSAIGLRGLAPPDGADAALRTFSVPRQATLGEVADDLARQELIRSPRLFEVVARLLGHDRSLRAGTYRVRGHVWAWQLLADLQGRQLATLQVTVPEGLTLLEVARLLEYREIADANDVLSAARDPSLLAHHGLGGESAEGYLFPETYTFAPGVTARQVVEAMVAQFFARVAQLPDDLRRRPEELRERVIVASIVEKEAADKTELGRIAGVFQNRLDRNMKLESCATVQYLLERPKEHLTLADVRQPSPYNTYLNAGLPPGPIANPGLAALRAALRPERHDLLFFFAKDDGSRQHVFTRTYAEHRAAQRLLGHRS